jgi:hypothetical protein
MQVKEPGGWVDYYKIDYRQWRALLRDKISFYPMRKWRVVKTTESDQVLKP